MLEPQRRSSLYDILRAPGGMELDCLVATTYSASLDTVLSLPAAMLADGADGRMRKAGTFSAADLAALRRVVSRTMVFCQGGAIHPAELVPPSIIEAEGMVHQVAAPNGGSFHPKVWIMRFRREDASRTLLRVAVMSRNLTGDRSWDAGVVLEGGAAFAKRERNDLGDLLRLLPGLCINPLPRDRVSLLEELAGEVESVRWKLPPEVGRPAFHLVGGAPGAGWSQPASDRLAIISPFLSAKAIDRLAETTKQTPLIVSRKDAIEACWPSLDGRFARTLVLSPPDNGGDGTAGEAVTAGGRSPQLHAKILIWEARGRIRMAIGSMNATAAAVLGRNVEFMVSLDCTKAMGDAGVEGLLERGHLGSVLEDFAPEPGAERIAPPFDDRPARSYLLNAGLHLQCRAAADGWHVNLVPVTPHPDIGTLLPELRFRPVTLASIRAAACASELARGEPARLPGTLDLSEITGFVFFEADGPDGPIAFTLNLEVRGVAEEERRHAALRSLLPDDRSLTLFLRVLLGDSDALETTPGLPGDGGGPAQWGPAGRSGILELLVRCAADEPARLRSVEHTLSAFSEAELLTVTSAAFRALWVAILEGAATK
ncbi:phospholipase D family protein [Sphingomonas sp. AAP5]|uniref:phospholipase D family protein n=1 Tax=Sphingomonas sp. AAP5 TaxID=1523415 RepID=UPI001404ED05|nr:phospholipase D family protein [Sphingomonas sp. AAP5]